MRRSFRHSSPTFVCVLVVSVLAAPAGAQTTVTDLGTLGGDQSIARSINEAGHVVGYAYLPDNSTRHATMWIDGAPADLGSLCASGCYVDHSEAYDINDHDVVVGVSNTANNYRGFVWMNGTMTALAPLAGDHSSIAYSINNLGQIAGRSCASSCRAVRWPSAGSAAEDLGSLSPGSVFHDDLASDINDLGQIVGTSFTGLSFHGFLWQNGAMTDLGGGSCVYYPDAYAISWAMGINESGVISGLALIDCVPQAVTWVDGVIRSLGSLAGPGGFSNLDSGGINEAGDVAGQSQNAHGCAEPTLWSQGSIVALPQLHESSTCAGGLANSLNDQGQIVGYASNRAVLWTTAQPDAVAPAVSASTTTGTLWPPNGKMVPVAFAGAVTDDGSGLDAASYAVVDEYGQVQPSGALTVDADGSYMAIVLLESRRNGNDRDGRKYTFTVTAADKKGNTSTASATTVVLGDPR